MAFTALDVKKLREQTGCGMMDCKKALTESDGDFDKAVEYLREKGLAAAAKKAGRIAAEGMVYAAADVANKVCVVIEVNAETDFVAKNDSFQTFVKEVADVVMAQNPADVEALMACKLGEQTVEAALQEKILVIGENIKIRRFARFEGVCSAYVHGGGTHGVLVQFDTDDATAAKAEFTAFGKEKEILLAQISNDPKLAGKPEPVKVKMVEGKIGKFYKENCLVDQAYVKEPDISVSKYVENTAKELGADIEIVKFVRFEKGEGLEKRADDFAAEVASMMK